MIDDHNSYRAVGKEFAGHSVAKHSLGERVRSTYFHSYTIENFFSIFMRGIIGVYDHVSEAHRALKR